MQLFDTRAGQPENLPVRFETEAKSGFKPGMAETTGVGAAADRPVEIAAVRAGLTGVSET